MADITRRQLLTMIGAAGVSVAALVARKWGGPVPSNGSTTTVPESTTAPTTPPSSVTTTANTTTTTTTTAPSTTSGPDGGIVVPAVVNVIERAAWGAKEASGPYLPHTVQLATIHHTATQLGSNSEAPARARGHQRFHQNDKGWVDLAYHFLIDLHGNVFEGRPHGSVGDTATPYDPTGHFLPCLEGNYEEQQPTDAQLSTLVGLLVWATGEFGLDPRQIGGHRDWAATACPGKNVYRRLEEIKAAVASAPTGTRLEYLRGEAGLERVASIEAGTD